MHAEIARDAIEFHGAQHDTWELATLLEVVDFMVRPKSVVEIGSWRGGSLYAWSRLLHTVIAVTLPERAADPFNSHGATVIWGDSHNVVTQKILAGLLGDQPPGLVFIDGDHSEDGARADLELAHRIAPDGVIAMHDINLHHRHPDVGVRKVWDQAAASWPHMTIERDPATAPGVGLLFTSPWK